MYSYVGEKLVETAEAAPPKKHSVCVQMKLAQRQLGVQLNALWV